MKKFLLIISCLSFCFSKTNAQAFTVPMDTVKIIVASDGSAVSMDNITNIESSGTIRINWSVIASNFPADWLSGMGICDNITCYSNGTAALWNGTSGASHTSDTIGAGKPSFFEANMAVASTATSGSFYVTARLTEPVSGQTKNVVFVVTKWPTAVPAVNKQDDEISLYPNPASNQVNIVFNADANVKTVAIYNLIGKMESIYKVAGNSAGINIENLPKGIYFVRLMNGQNNVVATRKFTKE